MWLGRKAQIQINHTLVSWSPRHRVEGYKDTQEDLDISIEPLLEQDDSGTANLMVELRDSRMDSIEDNLTKSMKKVIKSETAKVKAKISKDIEALQKQFGKLKKSSHTFWRKV